MDLFWKSYIFLITCGIWVKNCHFFGRIISVGSSKMQSECPGEQFEDKRFLEKKCSFWSFLEFEAVFFENFEGNTSARLSSLQSLCSGEECEQNFFSWKNYFFVIFVFSLKKLAFMAKKLQQGRHNGFLGIQRNVVGKKTFEKVKYFFRTLAGKKFGFSVKTFRQGCQKGVLRVLGNVFVLRSFFGKKIINRLTISRFWAKKFGILAEKFKQVYQNWV